MSYYFPFGASSALAPLNVSYSLAAVTASRPQSTSIAAFTASKVTSIEITPPNGVNGANKSAGDCTGTAPVGNQGVQGPRGNKGQNLDYCPAGTKWCPNLHVSLSAAWSASIGGTRGVNYYRSSGSQFIYVCIETAGYLESSVTCPDSLPMSLNYPVLP